MLKRFSVKLVILAAIYCANNFALAENQLQLYHKVLSSQQNGAYHTVSFMLTVDNFSNKNLNRVKLLPTSKEFSSFSQDKLINIGHLPSMGQAVIEWTVNTAVDVDYFQSGMPVFFVIKAKHDNGENIEIPVYSRRGAKL